MTEIQPHDFRYLERTLAIAKQAMQIGEAPIGAVIVANHSEIIATAHNRNLSEGSRVHHAEMQALIMAQKTIPRNDPHLTLYTSLEPCLMCFGMAIVARMNRVVWACNDPHGGVGNAMTTAQWAYYHIPEKLAEPFPDLRDASRQLMIKFWHAQDREDILAAWME
jgi:tRNA(adenine34) deaminase